MAEGWHGKVLVSLEGKFRSFLSTERQTVQDFNLKDGDKDLLNG